MASQAGKDTLLRLIREGKPLSFGQQLQLTFTLSLPAILANASAMVMQFIDAAMVGQLGADDSASVGLMGSTNWLFEGVLSAFAAGYAVQVAHLLGAKRNADARQVVRQAIVVCLLFSGLLAGLGLLLCKPLPVWLGAEAHIRSNATIYFGTFMLFVPFFMVDIVASSMLRSSGNMRVPSALKILMCVLDVIFNFLFIFPTREISLLGHPVTMPGAGLGVMGAALATILCQTLAAALVLAVLMKSRESYRLEPAKIRISREYLRRILKIGIPAMLQSMTYSVTNVILQVVVNGFGTAYVAGWAACAKGDQLFWMLTQSFGIAVTTFVGQNYGAGHYQRVRKCIRQGFLIETILTLACVAFLWTATGLILSLFTTDKEVFDLAFGMMHFFIPCYVTWICNEIISSTLRGLGDSIFPMIISISGVCVFRIVWVLTAVRIWPQFRTIMLSYPISWVLTSVLLVLYFSLVWMRSGRLKGIERPAGQKAPVW